MKFINVGLAVLSCSFISVAVAQEDPTLFLSRANARIAKAMTFKSVWDGPTSGPKIAAKKKLVVFIASDLKQSSLLNISKGVKEATTTAGWDLFMIDTYGIPSRRAEAFSRALALKPDGIILAGIDAKEHAKEISAAAKQKVPVIGWHAASVSGPADGLFTNVTTDPKEVAQTAALLTVVESNGKAGIVVFTDSTNQYSAAKLLEIAIIIKQCQGCSLLSVEEIPVASTAEKIPGLLAGLVKRHGKKWTHILAMNDHYFDLMASPAASETITENKIQAISAGDGAESAYRRIRNKSLQMGTIPEPFGLQSWQLVDELNRAFSAEKASGYTTPAYLVTGQNIIYNGGPNNTFEPNNGYRKEYQKIWGK